MLVIKWQKDSIHFCKYKLQNKNVLFYNRLQAYNNLSNWRLLADQILQLVNLKLCSSWNYNRHMTTSAQRQEKAIPDVENQAGGYLEHSYLLLTELWKWQKKGESHF